MKKTRRSWFARRVGAELLRRVTAWLCFLAMLVSDASPWAASLVAAQAADIQGMVKKRVLTCGLTEHIHDDSCYEEILTCGLEESEENVTISRKYVSNFKIHTHDAFCYNGAGELVCGWFEGEYYHVHNEYCRDENGNLVCGLETKKPHTHYDECFITDQVLICELTEDPGHIHTEDCYQTRTELTCGQEETAGHTHSESCYTAQAVLSCGQEASEEHQHSEACYTMESILSCGQEEIPAHSHSEACYTTFTDIICGQEERAGHTHGDSCYEMIQTLTCTLPTSTHKHTDECFDGNGHAICGKVEVPTFTSSADNWKETRTTSGEGHRHTAECYSKAAEPSCGLAEHVHTDDCYETVWITAVEENSDHQNEEGQDAETPTIDIIDEETIDPATDDAQDEVIIQTTEELTELATEDPTEEPAETPTEEATENLTEEPAETPAEESTEELTEEPAEAPAEESTEDSYGENPDQEPAEEPVETSTDESTENPLEATADSPAKEPTEVSTEEPGETPAEESNGASSEKTGEEDQAAQEDNSNEKLSEETNNKPTDESKKEEATDPSNVPEEEGNTDGSADTSEEADPSEEENQEARADEDSQISEEESLSLDVAMQLDSKLMAADGAMTMVETNALTVNASRPVTYDDDYVSILVSATGNKAPIIIAQNNVTGSGNGVTILGSWTVDGTTGNSTTTLFATLTDYPELGAADQLSFYAITGRNKNNLQLASAPLLDDLEIGNTAMVPLSTQGSNGTYGIALVKSPAKMEAGKTMAPTTDVFDRMTLSGNLPAGAIAEVTSASKEIEGQDVLAACDIKIYANNAQKALNYVWQPEGTPIHVTIQNDAFEDKELNVYHYTSESSEPELIDTVTARNGEITFAANSFSVYAITETILTETIVTSNGETYEITAIYQDTAGIPMRGTKLQVRELMEGDAEFAEYIAASAEAIGASEKSIELSRAFDIKIVNAKDNSIVYEPAEKIKVTIRLVGESLNDYASVDVIHFTDASNGEKRGMNSSISGENITFNTDGFSVYVVIGSTHLRTYRFYSFNEFGEYVEYPLYTDTGKTVFTQTIKDGEKPIIPQNPFNPQDPNATFAGWYEDVREEGALEPVLASKAYDFDNIPAITENEEVHLYAKFKGYAYIVLHDQYDSETETFPVAYTLRAEIIGDSAMIDISDYRVSYHGNSNTMVFSGWSDAPITIPGASKNDYNEPVTKLNESIEVTENKELYPIFTPAYWITYYSGYSGSGATYYPEAYYLIGTGPTSLSDHVPSRDSGNNGAYTFIGWYAGATLEGQEGKEEVNIASAVPITDGTGELVEDFDDSKGLGISVRDRAILLSKNVTLFAAWETTGTADYSIIVWKQKAASSDDVSSEEKTYDFAQCIIRNGNIGNSVTVDISQLDLNYPGFTYNGTLSNASATIAADGTTVLNLYFDREDQSTVPSGSYELVFADSVTNKEDQSGSLPIEYDQESGSQAKVAFGTELIGYLPSNPSSGREGYAFVGWYADEKCTVRAFFDETSYNEYSGAKVLYTTMPDFDITIYAGWEKEWYIVTIDPNYGALYGPEGIGGTGSTWFWSAYGGKIQEYVGTTRDYVESASGTWYYVNHDKSGSEAGLWPEEERKTYYTQNLSIATEFTTFDYEPGIYRYEGWYEVQQDGTEVLYDFSKIVDHDITLKLHWTKVGAFYLEYDPGIGTMNDNEDQETFYVELDGDTYADNAEVVITRIATPPDGYEFAGWKIRGDESGRVYYPGSSFTMLTEYAATVQGKQTVYLDAVYTKVPTASIVYDANGGTITEGELDYGRPYDATAPAPVYSCNTDSGTATISNLVNNSRVYLSDGSGFTKTDATFVGWSNKPVYNPEDDEAIFYQPGVQTIETYNVDISESLTLYAIWQVSVKYHLNQESSDANFGGDWGSEYALNATGDTYSQNVYIGTSAGRPLNTPVYTGSEDLTFRYWATKDDSDHYTMYDFAKAVTEALDLYAYWDTPVTVPIYAIDASLETLKEITDSQSDWIMHTVMPVSATSIDLSIAPDELVSTPADYEYAFAAVYNSADSLQDITEADTVTSIYYNSTDGKIHAVYKNNTDIALENDDEIYFIYYKQEKLDIFYSTMIDNGALAQAEVNSTAPSDTGAALGQYDMAISVQSPLAWLNDETYPYYAFAIGTVSENSAKDLTLITSTSNTDDTRPALLVKNTWRGFQYSIDNGTTWVNCGYEPKLYVVYIAKQATIVTFTENTVGLASDMGMYFSFDYKIETIVRSNNVVRETVYDTASNGSSIQLRNGEAYSVILFTDDTNTQRVTITQKEQTGFTTTVSNNGVNENNPFIYTSDEEGTAQNVIFTNTRDTAAMVEVHVAIVDVTNGRIDRDDDQRGADTSKYSFELKLGRESKFETVLPAADLFIGDSDIYGFGTILYGFDNGSEIIVDGMGVVSIACEPVDASDDDVFGIYLKDAEGTRLTELGDYTLYYLFYPMPIIRYMEETDGGVLNEIKGSLDGTETSDQITYNYKQIALNGRSVTQGQKIEIPQSGLVISQNVNNTYFNMPPLLDKGTDKLYLVYNQIGVGMINATNKSSISVSDDLTLYLQIRENRLEWSFDGNSWTTFTEMPTIYAIYQERGYTLEITKTVPIDTGYRDPFTVTISSTAINRASYAVEGTGNSTVSAIRADGSNPGTITVEVTDGSVIRIFGLGSGTYTVTESGNENHLLSIEENYTEDGNRYSHDLSVTDSSVTIGLDREKSLALTNTAKTICKVGTRYFNTIQSAVQWIEDNSATFSGTIEMLVDYLMPVSDAPVIPYYLDITLTTASEYGSGTATITRSGNFASGALFTNSGKLTLKNIILDGNGSNVAATSAMINNEGNLTISTGALLQNAYCSGNGGAINSWNGLVKVSGGTISENTGINGGAIYASGGDVAIDGGSITNNDATDGGAVYYTGTGSVTISGGSITENTATNHGGAVYLEKGTLTVSGGKMAANTAVENGGAVYADNGAIEVRNGTIGESEAANEAKNGGAIYLESGSVTVSGGTIGNNNASENGGGIFTGTGSVTLSGGNLSFNTAKGNGGGVYTDSGEISISGNNTAISSNGASEGGGLYSDSGSITISAATFSSNSATAGNGGGIYAGTGSVSLTNAKLTGNRANEGCGGGMYVHSGAATLTNCTFGGTNDNGNSAINGAAVYTNTGSATFSASNVTYNVATEGGAVGIGSTTARLYFYGNTVIKDNTMVEKASDVYLDQDSDAVINATGLGSGASIGIYVPDQEIEVTEISGEISTENLFDRRSVPGAFFGSYTNANNTDKFFNDRQNLSVQQETSTKRLYWGKAFTVEVRYLEKFTSASFSVVENGTVKNIDNKSYISYYAPSGKNAASEIANDLRSTHTINGLSGTAVYALAFVGDDRTFVNYITDVNWDSDANAWKFVKRDGNEITGEKLVIYFAEPAYIQIENNTTHELKVSELTLLGQSAINGNSDSSVGYGYVFAIDGVIQSELRPITETDLILQPGKSIKILFPGGKNAAWTMKGGFTGASEEINYSLNGTASVLDAATTENFQLNGTTLNSNGGTYNIIFGGKSAICRIVTAKIENIDAGEIAGKTDGAGEVEYTFSTLNQAVAFAMKHNMTSATIEMLVDYLIPGSDVITTLPTTCNFTFSTAIDGIYKFSNDPTARATISRDQGNTSSFIEATNGNYTTTLTVKNLIFDGKNIGGTTIRGGIIKTKAWDVRVDNVEFRNSKAQFGGGIYIESVNNGLSDKTPQGSLTVSNSRFINCECTQGLDKYGGGAIWTSMKDVKIEQSEFYSCKANQQGGAIFHYVAADGSRESKTIVDECIFDGCSTGAAAGSMESGALYVTVKNSVFRNSTSNAKNGGALNVWSGNSDNTSGKPTVASWVELDNCTFEHCYANNGTGTNGNGGAMRSTAQYNTIKNCTFIDARGNNGGAINIFNDKAIETKIINCTFQECDARNQGGAIYCASRDLIISGTSNEILNCTAQNAGGGIYHSIDTNGIDALLFSIENAKIDKCHSNAANGGGIFIKAKTIKAHGLTVSNCSAKTTGGGLYLYPPNGSETRSAELKDTIVQNCVASGNGGGIYHYNGNTLTIDGTNSKILHNTSGGMGGGIYTNALNVTLTGTTVADNTASSNGGGVCHDNNDADRLTVDSSEISGNISGGKGGGTYTRAHMTIRNNTHITGNRLTTEVKDDAAGVYLQNGRTLTIGTAGATEEDVSSVTGNLTNSGKTPSNLRLSQTGGSLSSNNSTNSIDVLCHLNGEFRVIDAFSKGTQFGNSEITSAENPVYTYGFSDIRHVFVADDDSLYGIIDRSDTSLSRIIWAGDPICKITDANGRLLYVDTKHEYPAVFDKLDTSDEKNMSAVSAFSLLRNQEPELYYADGTRYTGSTYQVKMLVENYTATNKINTSVHEGRTIILTTAGSADSQYPYRGRSGTRSTITRGTGMGNNNFITANVNLTLTNIVLDGGSESGVKAQSSTRIIYSNRKDVMITLGRNSALQNASVSGSNNGGAVYLENASLVIEGGAIRNCSAANGGAVYKKGSNGTVTMTGGSITLCTASVNGGGVYIAEGPEATTGSSFSMTGGSITRCKASKGGGVWIANNYKMTMTGGSISANSATSAGGGIVVGGASTRLFFSGSAFVYGNTCDASVASTKASNVQMDRNFAVNDNNPGTIIHTTGLIRGATIGVYVPGNDTGNNTTSYDKHGGEADPFGTYEGTPAGFNYFINDRNGLKGGLMESQVVGTDMKVYWRQIYTLEVNLEVLSRAASDKEKDIHFTITLSGNVGGKTWNEVNETYGDLDFHGGVANFTLNGSTNTTAMADLLPLGYGYTVTMNEADSAGFSVYPSLTQQGEMNTPSQFLYTVNYRLARDVICKIIDDKVGLLYYKRGEAYAEAVYDALVSAFNRVNMGELYYKVGDAYIPYNSNNHRIEMLIPEYEMQEAAALNAGKKVLLTTADPNADDGFPYAGGNSTAVIKRHYNGASMIKVSGDLSLGNITMDGDGTNHAANVNGGIIAVDDSGKLTVGTGATLQNSRTSGKGAGIYLAEDASMYISGAPKFDNNHATGVALGSTPKNGGDTSFYTGTTAKQDIYIAGYSNTDAVSLHVTGNITSGQGSIIVWAENSLHYEQSKQFAVMDGGIYNGLDAFRNARTDEQTKNPLRGDPLYLYGVIRGTDRKVYWYGGADLTITKIVTGDMGDRTKEFEFTVSDLVLGESYTYKKYETSNGTSWTEMSGKSDTLTSSNNTFKLAHNQRIVIESLPVNTALAFTEENGYYTTWWTFNTEESISGKQAAVTLTGNSELKVENNLPAVAPTGYNVTVLPYLFLLLAGALLFLVSRKKRHAEGGDV